MTINEMVRGKMILVTLQRNEDRFTLTVPEQFVTFAKSEPTPLAQASTEEVVGRDNSVRKSYYGATDGEQPWDVMKRLYWAPVFASSNVLKYLRRKKNSDDVDKARWYWVELGKMADEADLTQRAEAVLAIGTLLGELTEAEMKRLIPLTDFPPGAIDPNLIR